MNVEKSENLDYKAAENEDSIEKYLSHFKNEEITYLTEEMIFKMIVICLMKILKIQTKDSNETHNVVAFVLAVFSQLLQFVVIRLQESLLDMSEFLKVKTQKSLDNEPAIPEENGAEVNGNHVNGRVKKTRSNLLTKLRRPRNRKHSSDSDASDGLNSSTEDLNSDISETEEEVTLSDEDEALSEDLSDEETNVNGKEDKDNEPKEKVVQENENEAEDEVTVKVEANSFNEHKTANAVAHVAQKEKQNLDPVKVLKVLNDEKILGSIKVCCDWLQSNQDVIKNCANGLKSLLNRLVTLLNLINLDMEGLLGKWGKDLEIFSSLDNAKTYIDIVPLPEDLDLKGLSIFEDAHRTIDWDILRRKKITISEETLLRALKIVKFGHQLCEIPESGVSYDKNKELFVIKEKIVDDDTAVKNNQNECKNFDLDTSKGKLMRHMGKLWLKAEVRALESRLHQRLMSPYLVPDHEAFSNYMPVLKNLAYAKKFILVIPSVGEWFEQIF